MELSLWPAIETVLALWIYLIGFAVAVIIGRVTWEAATGQLDETEKGPEIEDAKDGESRDVRPL